MTGSEGPGTGNGAESQAYQGKEGVSGWETSLSVWLPNLCYAGQVMPLSGPQSLFAAWDSQQGQGGVAVMAGMAQAGI